MKKPWLTVVVVFHNMRREAPRTLYSLSPAYQRDVDPQDYQVMALDHGSDDPIEYPLSTRSGLTLDYRVVHTSEVSPVTAVNEAVARASTDYIMINVDGARILSPGVVEFSRLAARSIDNPFVYTLGWHLGPDVQNISMTQGYNRSEEDRLLQQAGWKQDGYRLFEISSLAGSSAGGFLNPIAESNCFTIRKEAWMEMGGFHPDFRTPGGGLVNLDFFQRACHHPGIVPVCLLGEGTFHQLHGGVATNVPMEEHPMPVYQDEYKRIRGQGFQMDTTIRPVYFGRLPDAARPFVKL